MDLNTTPALTPPEGQVSNLHDPYSLHHYLVATATVCLVLTITGVAARTFTKAYLLKKIMIEDYSLIFSVLCFSAFTGVMLLAGNAGQGRHQWNVSVAGVERVALLANILEILYPPAMFCAKFTILLQIQRIFASHQKNLIYWSIQALIGANFITYFATFVAFIFACWPREKIWNPHIPGRCISTNASIIVTSAINIISDVTILLLPLIGIKKLHLPAKKKIMVGAVFATGAFACISSIIRLVYSIQLTNTKDVTWAISPVGMWALAEFTTVILVGCFPTFPRLYQFLLRREQSSLPKYGYGSNQSTKPIGIATSKSWNGEGPYIPLEEGQISRNATPHTGPETDLPHPNNIQKRVDISMTWDGK